MIGMPMVVLRIPPDGSALVKVEKADPPQLYFKIYDLLSYRKDFGKWEKPESLYDPPYERTFPVGLLPRVKKFLNSRGGYRVRVKDERQVRGG